MGVDEKEMRQRVFLVGTAELESATFCMSSKRSNQLSYAPAYTCPTFVLYQHFYVFASIYSIIFRQLIVFAYAEYMNTARLAERVTVKRFVKRVVSVRSNKYSPAGKSDDDGRVVKISRGGAELYDIAGFQFIERSFFRKGTNAFVAGQKVIKILYTRPGRRSVVNGFIIPTERGRKIHNFSAGINTLRCKISAIAAYVVKIVIRGVSAECPPSCIFDGGGTVIRFYFHAL